MTCGGLAGGKTKNKQTKRGAAPLFFAHPTPPPPQKVAYEFSDRTIPKSHAALSVGHYLADTFMDYARACPHKPVSVEQELADLIYNTKPYFTAREIVMEASYDGPDITYFFDKKEIPADEDGAVAPRRATAF